MLRKAVMTDQTRMCGWCAPHPMDKIFLNYHPSQSRIMMGWVPQSGPRSGYPSLWSELGGEGERGWVSKSCSRSGYPLPLALPQTTHTKDRIRQGQYTSCGHTGGLSCFIGLFRKINNVCSWYSHFRVGALSLEKSLIRPCVCSTKDKQGQLSRYTINPYIMNLDNKIIFSPKMP